MKRRFRALLWLVLAGGVAALLLTVVGQMRRAGPDLIALGLRLAPGVLQEIRDFRRTKVEDGRVVWEVSASSAEVLEGMREIRVHDIGLAWHLEDGRQVGLRCRRGTLTLAGREIESIELEGDVVVTLADYEARLDRAVFDEASRSIWATGQVEIVGRGFRLQGTGVEIDLPGQRLGIHAAVWTEMGDFSPAALLP